ncbi:MULTISPECIES: hypothetical protein [Jonquetella]|uniref:Uncharacterized protein n=1 Tax=Jonquetella anthropi DSM 22815 TaxID=885272 RepID=H0UKI4_9BACT|nr:MULTISPECIES: hypothetical protein [Jonquetella]EHM13193.1 hypothetical protein JonanDRAFT_0815 [Jonquetella anthropi DSM 22815]ERL23718.1 hypothetical protein HMPREF1249_0657 [Jonquetella sp. BV3C21]
MNLKSAAIFAVVCSLVSAPIAQAAEWQQTQKFRDKFGGELTIIATYYGAAEVDRQVRENAEKNLWTEDEADQFRYTLLRQLKLDEYIPIHLKFITSGPALRMSPFGSLVDLIVGKNHISPADYEKKFNFKITDQIDGFVYFPRENAKGKPFLTDKTKQITLTLNGSGISPVVFSKNIHFAWDVSDDQPDKMLQGAAGAKLEIDRLLKRLTNLNERESTLQKELNDVQAEKKTVNDRINVLQGNK